MITTYRLALRLLAFGMVAAFSALVLFSGGEPAYDIDAKETPQTATEESYSMTLARGLDCDTDGALPTIAIVTYKDQVAPVRVTNPTKVGNAIDHALKKDLDPKIDRVHALCIR